MADESTGVPTLDALLGGGLSVGDNTIFLGDPEGVAPFVQAFLDAGGGRSRVVRIGSGGAPSARAGDVLVVDDARKMDADDLESVILGGSDVPGSRLVVDGLDDLALQWGVPAAVAFYRRACPRLYDAGAIAYWTATRAVLPPSAIDKLTMVAQIVFEVSDARLKVAKAEGHAPRLRGSIIELAGDLERPVLSREHTVGRIGEGLRRIRHERDLTQHDVSRLAGVTPGAISQAETGRRGLSLDTLVPLCDALGIGIDDLLGASATDDYHIARRDRRPDAETSLGSELPGLRIHLVRLPPGGSGRPAFRHKGREVVLAIEGLVMVELDEAMPVVRHGDSLTVIRSVIRSWTNLGEVEARFFWLALD